MANQTVSGNQDTPLPNMVCYKVEDPDVLDGAPLLLYSYSQFAPIQMILTGIWKDGWYLDGLRHIANLPAPVVLDVGAHIGVSAIYFSQCGKAKIYALEPSPDSFECLGMNIEGRNIIAYNTALFNGRGARMVGFPRYSALGDSFFMGPQGETPEQRCDVLAMDIMTFLNRLEIKHVDLMKINSEGSEYMVFLSEAFKEAASMIDMIVGEAHYAAMPPEICRWALEQLGYSFRWLPIRNHHYHWVGTMGAEDFDIQPDVPTLFVAERK
jgi:FkbM family methyltransferase